MSTPLHLIDLGAPVDDGVLRQLLQSNGGSELVRGILQTLRDTAFDRIKQSKEAVLTQNALFIATKLGEHDALESMVLHFASMMLPPESGPAAQDESLLDEVPTK